MQHHRLGGTWVWMVLVLCLMVSANASAAAVFVLSTGNTADDMAIKSALEARGHVVDIGPQFIAFDGTGLAAYDAVLLVPSFNYGAGDMPLAGQMALLDFVSSGHGLVTGEWTVWKTGTGALVTLSEAVPVVATTTYRSIATVTYTSVTPDDILNTGVDSSFTFTADFIGGGTETSFVPKDGATTFYGSDYPGGFDGVTGWNYGLGRVMSFSTLFGPSEDADVNYGNLLGNAVTWSITPPQQ